MWPHHMRMTRDSIVVLCLFLENPCEYPHKLYIARNKSLNYMMAATVWVCLYLIFL